MGFYLSATSSSLQCFPKYLPPPSVKKEQEVLPSNWWSGCRGNHSPGRLLQKANSAREDGEPSCTGARTATKTPHACTHKQLTGALSCTHMYTNTHTQLSLHNGWCPLHFSITCSFFHKSRIQPFLLHLLVADTVCLFSPQTFNMTSFWWLYFNHLDL